MKVTEPILHAAPIGFTKSIWKTSTEGELESLLNCDICPFANVFTLFDNQKQKFRIHVTGYILIYRKLNAKLIIPFKKTSWLVLDNPINTTVRITQK